MILYSPNFISISPIFLADKDVDLSIQKLNLIGLGTIHISLSIIELNIIIQFGFLRVEQGLILADQI